EDLEAALAEDDRLGTCAIGLVRGDAAVAHHQVEHLVLARLRSHRILEWVVSSGLLWDTSEKRRLGEREVAGLLAEVALRCCLDADVDAAVRDRVEVPLKDLLLGVLFGQL